MLHELKTWPRHFEAVYTGRKRFEFRVNDRNFQVGDILYLREWEPSLMYAVTKGGEYTGRSCVAQIAYILRDSEEQPEFVPDNWVIMSIDILAKDG